MALTVLHVVDRLSGGVPIAVRAYIENSDPEFHHVIAAPFVDGSPAPSWRGLRAQLVDLGPRVAQPARIGALTRSICPAALHAHSSFPGLMSRLARTKGVPIVYSPHCFKFDDPAASPALREAVRRIERALARRTDCFAVLSEHEAELARALYPGSSIQRIPNAASAPHREDRSTITHAPPHMGMIGRIAPQKDPDFFAEVATLVKLRREGVSATWIGNGEVADAERLSAQGVRVTGWLQDEPLVEAIDQLGVYVHTARYEGFPLSVLDAATRRVPILARRIPALQEAGLHTFETPAEAASLVARALDDVAFRSQLVEAGDAMTRVMNSESQRRALKAAWSTPAASTR